MKNMHKMHKKKQSGFTILEIGVVMIILVSLVLAFSSGLWEKQTSSDIKMIQQFFEKDIPNGLASCRMIKNNVLEGMTKTDFIACSRIGPNIVGLDWGFTDVSGGLTTITVDLGTLSEVAVVGGGVETNITNNNYGHISSFAFANDTLTAEIKVR